MMIVLVEMRASVAQSYVAGLERLGIVGVHFEPAAFIEWLGASAASERGAVEAVVVGEVDEREEIAQIVTGALRVPLVALMDQRSLSLTLSLFSAGFDDVVGKPVHVQEIMARIARIAIRRQVGERSRAVSEIIVFSDGRDPVVRGEALALPRRERRILECLCQNQPGWLTKSQIFNRVYGVFDEQYDESVIESHICRLRRRLRMMLGYDPVESQRYLGYRLCLRRSELEAPPVAVPAVASLMQTRLANVDDERVLAERGC